MALLTLTVQPTRDVTKFVTSVELETGQVWRLTFLTNKYADNWTVNLSAADGTPIVTGLVLAVGVDLFFPYRHLDVPPGSMWVQRTDVQGSDPAVNTFEEENGILFYLTEDEAFPSS